MVELPEALVVAEQLEDSVVGKRIRSVTAAHTPHKFAWYSGDPAEYHHHLAGKTVSSVKGLGSNIELSAGDMILLISDGPSPRFHAEGEAIPERHQLLLQFEDGSAISVTIRLWGGLLCFPAEEPVEFTTWTPARAKPSPLSDGFDEDYFRGLLEACAGKLSLKAFLATEQRIPGLGNGVLQDILFQAGMHPKKKLASLTDGDRQQLFSSVKRTLAEMTERGGRDTEMDLFGNPGGYRTVLSKNTVQDPCPACGAVIQKAAYMGGNIYFCPDCQRM